MLQAEYKDLADEYVRQVKEFYGARLVSVCFFGSVVRREATPESDLDVLIIAQNLPADMGFRVRETSSVHEKLRRSEAYLKLRAGGRSAFISEVFLNPEEVRKHPPILLDVTEDGFIVYDKDDFLKDVIADISQRLRELGARRVKAKKGYYWILKPDAKPTEVIEI